MFILVWNCHMGVKTDWVSNDYYDILVLNEYSVVKYQLCLS